MATTLHPFQRKVQENRDSGMTNADAMRQARADDEAGFQSWLESHTRQHGAEFAGERLRRKTA